MLYEVITGHEREYLRFVERYGLTVRSSFAANGLRHRTEATPRPRGIRNEVSSGMSRQAESELAQDSGGSDRRWLEGNAHEMRDRRGFPFLARKRSYRKNPVLQCNVLPSPRDVYKSITLFAIGPEWFMNLYWHVSICDRIRALTMKGVAPWISTLREGPGYAGYSPTKPG